MAKNEWADLQTVKDYFFMIDNGGHPPARPVPGQYHSVTGVDFRAALGRTRERIINDGKTNSEILAEIDEMRRRLDKIDTR